MAKRKASKRSVARSASRKSAAGRRPAAQAGRSKAPRQAGKARGAAKAAPKAKRTGTAVASRKAAAKRTAGSRQTTKPRGAAPKTAEGTHTKAARLDRVRRTLEETVPTPPSSLDMVRRGTAARTGRAEIAQHKREAGAMSALTGGDVDADWETAYFSGDEAPGGDNPTPDQDVVDDIGKALGVQYEDTEELKASDKVAERDKHRWELDPASSEDYRDRD